MLCVCASVRVCVCLRGPDAPPPAASPYATIFFDSLQSKDPDGDILWLDWDFGDGIHSTDPQVRTADPPI